MKKTLICDDSATDLMRLSMALEAASCTVIKTTKSSEMLALAKEHQPDVIFLDIVMPDQDGFTTCRELVNDNETKDIPIIFVSSKGKKADRIWAKMQGATDLVQKPFDDSEIVEKLSAL